MAVPVPVTCASFAGGTACPNRSFNRLGGEFGGVVLGTDEKPFLVLVFGRVHGCKEGVGKRKEKKVSIDQFLLLYSSSHRAFRL